MTVYRQLIRQVLFVAIGIFVSVGGTFWFATSPSNAAETDESGWDPVWAVRFFEVADDDLARSDLLREMERDPNAYRQFVVVFSADGGANPPIETVLDGLGDDVAEPTLVLPELQVAYVSLNASGLRDLVKANYVIRVGQPVGMKGAGADLRSQKPNESSGIGQTHLIDTFNLDYKGDGVGVAYIDTGFPFGHPDFDRSTALARAYDCDASRCRSGGADGVGHGTAVAGILAGDGRSGAPASGTPQTTLYSYKVANAVARVEDSRSLLVAVDQLLRDVQDAQRDPSLPDVKVLNLSVGSDRVFGPDCARERTDGDDGLPAEYFALSTAINQLRTDLGVTTVAATGNDGVQGSTTFPSCLSAVVSVAGTGDARGESLWRQSNFSDEVDLVAPAANIATTAPGGKTSIRSGTSFAAPFVASCVAAMYDANSQATPGDIARAIDQLANSRGATKVRGSGSQFAVPRLDCLALVQNVRPDQVRLIQACEVADYPIGGTYGDGTPYVHQVNLVHGAMSIEVVNNSLERRTYHVEYGWDGRTVAGSAEIEVEAGSSRTVSAPRRPLGSTFRTVVTDESTGMEEVRTHEVGTELPGSETCESAQPMVTVSQACGPNNTRYLVVWVQNRSRRDNAYRIEYGPGNDLDAVIFRPPYTDETPGRDIRAGNFGIVRGTTFTVSPQPKNWAVKLFAAQPAGSKAALATRVVAAAPCGSNTDTGNVSVTVVHRYLIGKIRYRQVAVAVKNEQTAARRYSVTLTDRSNNTRVTKSLYINADDEVTFDFSGRRSDRSYLVEVAQGKRVVHSETLAAE